jgi:hypothetical protein
MTTMLAQLKDGVATTTDEVLPRVGERVIVQCEGFRCLGVCDHNGRWVDAYNDRELPDVLWFEPLEGACK